MNTSWIWLIATVGLGCWGLFSYQISQVEVNGFLEQEIGCGTVSLQVSLSASAKRGEKLFRTNCATCHKIHRKLTGPRLAGISQRYPTPEDKAWLYRWIRNSPGMIAAGDARAIALFEENNQVAMTAFPNLSNRDIDDIIVYVEESSW